MLIPTFLRIAISLALFRPLLAQSIPSLSRRALTELEEGNALTPTRRHRRSVDASHRISRRTPLLNGALGNLLNDILNTFGQGVPNGCSGKEMKYTEGQGSFDKDSIAQRFDIYHNAWGSQAATPDSFQTTKCHRYDHILGITVWSTAYDWKPVDDSKKNQVKSYCNAGWAGTPVQISALKKFETTWKWSYEDASQDLVSDVSYDIFTSKSKDCSGQAGGCATHEVMIWLSARGGALPAGSKVDDKTITVEGGYTFSVYKGEVGGIPVISLVPSPADKEYTNFSANLIPLMGDLAAYGLEADEYISTIGAGTEPFMGKAKLVTEQYSLLIN
ncbi:endoglucanase [Melampsora larici-populina 98AG31]|uniref:Endoglucanase n=1 Tax=Melampsora larici-populina (strain 98AG31 / pathotype 3-4-7) TaxID=747676 RepID=F4RUI3_MELLP|nr:endoglucanase [Melampsora larici-populina 98AG31]EGG03941.1 endoglucanase [Melampsora larici-populina 98AG31]